MADLILKGPLNLSGSLTLEAVGGKVKVKVGESELVEVLVELSAPPTDPHHGTAKPPVILPPPPAPPADAGTNVWIINSFNKSIMIKTAKGKKYIVTQGIVMQGGQPGGAVGPPTWPGMVLPSQKNTGPTKVTINNIPINVKGDQAVIFPSGGTAMLTEASGQ